MRRSYKVICKRVNDVDGVVSMFVVIPVTKQGSSNQAGSHSPQSHPTEKVKSCYNLLRLGTVIVLASSGNHPPNRADDHDFISTDRQFLIEKYLD